MPIPSLPTVDAESIRFLSVEAAARYLSVSAKTIQRRITQGEPPAYRMGKNLVRVKAADLLDLLIMPGVAPLSARRQRKAKVPRQPRQRLARQPAS